MVFIRYNKREFVENNFDEIRGKLLSESLIIEKIENSLR